MAPSKINNREKNRKTKRSIIKKRAHKGSKGLNDFIKIDLAKNWCFLKPKILKYGDFKYYLSSKGKVNSYFSCGYRFKGCKVSISVVDGIPMFIKFYEHNHS